MKITNENLHKYAQESLDTTQHFLDECGPRLAGSDGSKKAAEMFQEELKESCDTTSIEKFDVYTEAFIGFMKVFSMAHVIASIFLVLTLVWNYFVYFALAILVFGNLDALLQFVLYTHVFDKLYKKKTGYNAVGTIKPEEEIKQRVIFAGHHDTVHIFNFIESKYQSLYGLRIVLGLFSTFITTGLTIYWSFSFGITNSLPNLSNFTIIFAFSVYIFVIPLFFFVRKEVNLGAGDNMIASAMVLKLAELFKEEKIRDPLTLKNTELVFASFDGEESGLVGARKYAQLHKKDLQSVPTYVFNIDSVYELENLQFLTRDINGFQKLSKTMAEECKQVAGDLGYSSFLFPFTFGGGGTDAAEFARIGVEATTLLAMATDWVRDGLKYHTSRDLVNAIEPKAVEACINIAYNYALQKASII